MTTDAALKMTHHDRAIRLTMPARVANDLGSLQRGLRSLAERLGHPKCATGCDVLHLMLERELSLSERVELNPQPLPPRGDDLALGLPQDPVPLRTVLVSIPARVNNDIEGLTKAVGVVVGKLGCAQCCSGFDILFQQELEALGVDERFNVTSIGR